MQTKSQLLAIAITALVAAALFIPAPPASAGPGHVNFTIGQKMFSDDWKPIEKQTSFGAEGAFGPATWPVQMATYLLRASNETTTEEDFGAGGAGLTTVDGSTTEFGFGLNKTLGTSKIRPYIGAGGVYVKTDISLLRSGTSWNASANGFGFWGGAGAFYRLGPSFNFGAGVRYSSASVDYSEFNGTTISYPATNVEAGGTAVHVLIGWSWPKMAK